MAELEDVINRKVVAL